jgi:hypothetical protein
MPSPNRILVLIVLLLLTLPVHAQETDTTRDPQSLAQRLLGYDGHVAIPSLTPVYETGDTAEFWVSKANADEPTQISARLVAVTPRVYLWVEEGQEADGEAMQAVAQQIDQILLTLRLEAVYGNPTIIPDVGEIADPTSLLAMPDVDHDPHLFVLYATDLGDELFIYNFNDELPAEIAPGGYSNQHELIVINTSVLVDAPPDNPAYVTILAQAMYEMLSYYHTPQQDQWLRKANGVLIGRLLELPDIRPNASAAYMQQPNTSLITPASSVTNTATHGAQQLFLDYVIQRVGISLIQHTFQQPGQGLEPLDAALEAARISDPISGKVITGDQLFADFAAANVASYLVSQPFGDGRYLHSIAELPANTPPSGFIIENDLDVEYLDVSVNRYATQYFYIASQQPAHTTLNFTGQPTSSLLRLPADADPENTFYWSGRAANQDVTLTRAFDLTGVETATLTFDVWYDVPPARQYAYVEVSTDGGKTWAILQGDLSSTDNRYGIAYGPGYTGISSREAPRPFPIIGILLEPDGVTVDSVSPDGPASTTDLQAGDVIIGYDEQVWQGAPDVIGLLANYDPGDTINLYVQRGEDERLSIPVTLGEHPTRVKQPDPVWIEQSIDLSAYTGQEILLRFESVSQPQGGGSGVALDNIAIAEIDFADDASGESDWELNGWQVVENQVPQRFVVQYLTSGTQTTPPRVRQLIGPDDEATSGEWGFDLLPNEIVVFTVSALSHDTLMPAQFDFVLVSD